MECWFSTLAMGGHATISSFGYNAQPSHLVITFSCISKSKCSPTTMFSKFICRNTTTLLLEHRNKWESALHVDGYNVVGVLAIPYLGFNYIITIVSKEDMTHLVSIADNPQCICLYFARLSSMAVGKKFPANICIICLGICAR